MSHRLMFLVLASQFQRSGGGQEIFYANHSGAETNRKHGGLKSASKDE